MKTYRTIFLNLILLIACIVSATAISQHNTSRVPARTTQQSAKQKVYVAPFSSRGKLDSGLAVSFTSEFERALIHTQCYDVLERNEIDQLVKQARNERNIATINDLGRDITGKLHIQGATAVIFGEVDEDSNSGEVVFIAKMEYFNSTIAWERASSLSKGLVYNPASRIGPVRQLIDNLCPGQAPISTPSSDQARPSSPSVKPSMLTVQSHGVEVQLKDCRRAGQSVTCYLTFTNQDDFRVVAMSPNQTAIYDSKSRAYRASQVSLAGIRHGGNVEANLLQNRAAEATVTFETVPPDVSEIDLLILDMNAGGWFQLKLPGPIPIR